jgi:hypothetical protein
MSDEALGVAVTAATGGGTAMRADGQAVWLIPRPTQEVVPAGTRAVSVSIDRLGGGQFPVSTVTAPRKIRQLLRFVDSRQLAQPGVTACREIGPDTTVLDLRFLAPSRGTPLARVVENGCGGLSLSIQGHSEPGLEEDVNLTGLLWKLGALPVCRAAQLSGSTTLPTRFPAPPELMAEIGFRDVSSTTCSLNGFAGRGRRSL